MLTIKNGQILLYCYFNKIIKGPGTSFQSPVLNQKHVRNIRLQAYLIKFLFECIEFRRNKHKWNFTTSNVYDDVKDFEICLFHKNTKI